MKNPIKALEAIERLVGDDFGLDMEWLLTEHSPKRKIDPRLQQAAKIIVDIYLIAHAEICYPCIHEKWENRKYEILKQPEE